MEHKNVQRAGSFLEFCIFITFVWFGGSPRLVMAGAPYLTAAMCVALVCVILATRLRTKERSGTPEPAVWYLKRKAYVLTLFAWELGIVGCLNIQAVTLTDSGLSVVLGYVWVAVFIVLSCKMVTLADASKQDGGSMPISFFRLPRPRWIFFCGFVYSLIGPLVVLSLSWSGHKWCPAWLQPPQIWLVLLTLLSALSAVMVFQRYLRAPRNRAIAMWVIVPTLCGLTCTAVLQAILRYNVYVCVLSSTTVACMSATVYWLLLAKDGSREETGTA